MEEPKRASESIHTYKASAKFLNQKSIERYIIILALIILILGLIFGIRPRILFVVFLGVLAIIIAAIWIISPDLLNALNKNYVEPDKKEFKPVPFYRTDLGFRLTVAIAIIMGFSLNIHPIYILIPAFIWISIEILLTIKNIKKDFTSTDRNH